MRRRESVRKKKRKGNEIVSKKVKRDNEENKEKWK